MASPTENPLPVCKRGERNFGGGDVKRRARGEQRRRGERGILTKNCGR